MRECFPKPKSSFATKADLKNAIGGDTSDFAKN